MRFPAQLFERREVVARGDKALGQLGDPAQLVAHSLQIFVPHTGGEPEVIDLAHGLQDITSLSVGLMIDPTPPGLCADCRWMRRVTTRRGSVFLRCLRADTDPSFPRYPALPVRRCAGFDRSDAPGDADGDR
ncbi:MAG: hypothetical protein Q8Q14_06855 [Gemmatimonadales bacterium]|nr:hypothetical protein [Gemmatimonadales bacterium]